MIVAASACCGQDSLDKARNAKLKQAVTALAGTDADALRAVLNSERQTISKEESKALLKIIASSWGDLKMLQEINEADLKTTFDKGDMHELVHWGKLPTQFGTWKLYASPNQQNHYLRIGLLFAKGNDYPGQFVVCEIPKSKKMAAKEPDRANHK